ncbi:hypothetical protein [Nocardiopsis sp. HUAS JQ3]|uniref:hypothetical protein n=1 Tax=Nocardiopsis sp. HUAS JQ3 TaxID=3061629 RepID=UPI0023A9E6B4|nr:hypothetical protein [Nocardiopsis sp. HUAS JQ3]WDZ91166.1 hypothetical protein PV789_00890 [Nocardiopsis sp. HUAS JQ3]
MISAADRAEAAVGDALALAGAVRRRDLVDIHRLLCDRPPADLYALCVVLAAAIPDDAPLPDLLAWVAEEPPTTTERTPS